MDTLFLLDDTSQQPITEQDTVDAILAQSNEQFLLTRQDPEPDLLSEDPLTNLLTDTTRDIVGGGGGGTCPPCNEVFKVLFTNIGNVVLLIDGRIATGRY